MKKRILKLALLITVCCVASIASGQVEISAAGGSTSGGFGTLNFTLGQVCQTAAAGENLELSEGVQQPRELFTVAIEELEVTNFHCKIFPNPTADRLIVAFQFGNEQYSQAEIDYRLIDLNGRQHLGGTFNQPVSTLSVQNLPSGAYFLILTREGNKYSTYQITKI